EARAIVLGARALVRPARAVFISPRALVSEAWVLMGFPSTLLQKSGAVLGITRAGVRRRTTFGKVPRAFELTPRAERRAPPPGKSISL
ncbi:MAG TPA: hypothetical protein VGF13_06485, partial [Verrucomicrobiae bacterium]